MVYFSCLPATFLITYIKTHGWNLWANFETARMMAEVRQAIKCFFTCLWKDLGPCYQVPATAEIPYQRFLNRYTWANTHIDIVKVFMWWQCVFSNCASWKTLLHHKSCTDLGATMFGSFHSYGVFDIPVLVFVHRHLCNWPVMLLWCHSCAMEGKKKTNSSVFIKHPPGINSKHCKCFLY